MPDPTVLRASSDADLIAAIPRLTGINAPESCFIVCFSTTNGKSRTQGSMRVDLPDDLERHVDDNTQELNDWLVGITQLALNVDRAVIYIQTDAKLSKHPEESPQGNVALQLTKMMSLTEKPLLNTLVSGADGWTSFANGTERPDLNWHEDAEASELHDPSLELTPLDEWRAQNPGRSASGPQEIATLTERMKASTSR